MKANKHKPLTFYSASQLLWASHLPRTLQNQTIYNKKITSISTNSTSRVMLANWSQNLTSESRVLTDPTLHFKIHQIMKPAISTPHKICLRGTTLCLQTNQLPDHNITINACKIHTFGFSLKSTTITTLSSINYSLLLFQWSIIRFNFCYNLI